MHLTKSRIMTGRKGTIKRQLRVAEAVLLFSLVDLAGEQVVKQDALRIETN